MTIRERLQIIGQAWTGKTPVKEIVKEVQAIEKQALGSFFDFKPYSLSDETKVSSKVLEANKGWVYKNTDVIAKEVSGIEFELYTTKIVGQEIVYNPITSHRILDALDRFNEFTSASDGFYTTESHRLLAGDAFWYIDGSGININGIYILPPDKVELVLGKAIAGQRIIDKYQYKDTIKGDPVNEDYKPEEIIHFRIPNPKNPYRGLGKVEAAADAIDTDTYAIEANKKLFQRGLISNFVLTTPNKLTDAQLKQLHAEFKASYQGVENAFKVPIFGSDLKPESVQLSNKDMQFLDQQMWLRDKITSIWGNPKSIITTDDVNRSNADSTILNWKQTTIRTEYKQICDTLNEFFVPRFGTNLILGFKDPVPEDNYDKVEAIKILIENKIITQNEARELVGMEPSKEEGTDLLRQPLPPALDTPVVPKALKYVELSKHLRRSGLYKQKEFVQSLHKVARPTAEKLVKSRKKKTEEPREHIKFTNEQVWDFHNKQIHLVEVVEQMFENKCIQFINGFVERALARVPEEVEAMKNKQLVDESDEVVKAVFDFRPILMEAAILSGNEALKLISDDGTYIPTDIRGLIEKNIEKFAKSMIQTDKDKMIDLIAQGISEGHSIPKIRQNIIDEFDNYSKVQANRITRTEVLKTSNQAALDAWEKSGVVEGKQWLTAMDDRVEPLCASMNGKVIIGLKKNYFDKGDTLEVGDHKTNFDYSSIKEPPLHPNCRCTLLPILIGENAFDADRYLNEKGIEADIKELESKIDKRTKDYRKIKERNLELEQYVKELEGLVNEELEATKTEG